MTQRPDQFTLNGSHPLATGLVFFGGGAMAGSSLYKDSSLYGNDGTGENLDAAQPECYGRKALAFNGTDQRVNLGTDVGDISVYAKGTWSAWVRTTSVATSNHVVTQNNANVLHSLWRLLLNSPTAGKVRFRCRSYTNDSLAGETTNSVSINDGEWHHVSVSWDKTTLSLQIYVDGAAVATTLTHTDAGSTFVAFDQPVYIGYFAYDNVWGEFDIADFAWHTHRLSLSEIQVQASGDPMLGGLILPPDRKWWPVSAAGGASTWLWSRQHSSQVIGGGAL